MAEKSKMPLFIQALYGTVLGVGTYKIAFLNSNGSESYSNGNNPPLFCIICFW